MSGNVAVAQRFLVLLGDPLRGGPKTTLSVLLDYMFWGAQNMFLYYCVSTFWGSLRGGPRLLFQYF